VYDPVAMDIARILLAQNSLVKFCTSSLDTLNEADALIIITEWDEFRGIEKKEIVEKMRGNSIIDGRNIWNKSDFSGFDIVYESI